MSEKQQTAVEWLVREFRKNRITVPMEMEQQAKEMEKIQQGQVWDEAIDEDSIYTTFDDYYAKTYSK